MASAPNLHSQKCWVGQQQLCWESLATHSPVPCRWAGSCPLTHMSHTLILIHTHSHMLSFARSWIFELVALWFSCKTVWPGSKWTELPAALQPSWVLLLYFLSQILFIFLKSDIKSQERDENKVRSVVSRLFREDARMAPATFHPSLTVLSSSRVCLDEADGGMRDEWEMGYTDFPSHRRGIETFLKADTGEREDGKVWLFQVRAVCMRKLRAIHSIFRWFLGG